MFSISNSSLLSHFLISFRMLIELIGNSWALCLKILARTVMESKSVSVLIMVLLLGNGFLTSYFLR